MSGRALGGSLFSGYGGLDLAMEAVFGTRTAWHAEIDPAASRVLETHWPGVPNHGDVTAVDWSAVEPVDVLAGGFPCQDVSQAGRRAGMRPGTRSGLWSQMSYAIDQLRPRWVVAENVRGLLSEQAHSEVEPCPLCVGDQPIGALRALGAVLGDLAELGYDARWCGLRAADVGAPHGRFRVFILARTADAGGAGLERPGSTRGAGTPGRQGTGPGRPDASGCRAAAADADRYGSPRIAQLDGDPLTYGQEGAQRGHTDRLGVETRGVEWGAYGPAIARWERLTGRAAPIPTEPGRNGPRLAPAFVEWMMGLRAGWVTDVPRVTRNEQLRMLGNGVVPQQAVAALEHMLAAP